MKKNFLNIALAATALVAIVVLTVFFIKLDSLAPSKGKESTEKEDTVKDTKKGDGLSALTGKNGTSEDQQDGKDKGTEVKATPTPKPTATPTPSPSPTPSPTPTPVPMDTETVNVDWIDPVRPIVALSFDDGPSKHTDTILETLAEYNVHATFFMVGENIQMYPEKVKKVHEQGCEVANHTVNHANLNKLSKEEIIKEIENNQDKLNEVLGLKKNYLVRPPYGNANDTVKSVAGHPLINWYVDTLDWSSKDADAVFAEVKKSTIDGAIILMHDLYGSTAEAVKKVVPWLVQQGYQVCSVSEMFAAREEKLENGKVYHNTITGSKYKDKKDAEKAEKNDGGVLATAGNN
ncbi:MAG: polysaccharide deacetylase family protein [Lachnospiraceae bacterium]|nr:polysaccharide deacetylase family protein [Lachnospiraceae bacterium]